jgi:hypothetical protein
MRQVRNVNLGSNRPYYFTKGAENSATLSENISFQIYTKSVKLSTGKGTGHARTDRESPEVEQMYCCALTLTPAQDGVSGQRHAPAASTPPPPPFPGKDPVPTIGWAPGTV